MNVLLAHIIIKTITQTEKEIKENEEINQSTKQTKPKRPTLGNFIHCCFKNSRNSFSFLFSKHSYSQASKLPKQAWLTRGDERYLELLRSSSRPICCYSSLHSALCTRDIRLSGKNFVPHAEVLGSNPWLSIFFLNIWSMLIWLMKMIGQIFIGEWNFVIMKNIRFLNRELLFGRYILITRIYNSKISVTLTLKGISFPLLWIFFTI